MRAPKTRVSKKGGIYFTGPAARETQERSHVLYRRASGELVLIDDQFVFPNGVMSEGPSERAKKKDEG